MRQHSPAEPSQRQLRVGEQIKHIVAETLRRGHFHDSALLDAGKITVTEVRASPDLKNATAYVILLGGGEMGDILKALNDAAPVFQKDIGRLAAMKFTPRMRFVADESFDNAKRIDELLGSIQYAKPEE